MLKKRGSTSSIQQSPAPSPVMTVGAASPSPVVAVDVRLSGKVFKKNTGFLRQWRPRMMQVTSDGLLRYEKKKGDSNRVRETDLLKAEISPNLPLQGQYYCIEVKCGQKHFVLGFVSKSEARLWQEMMLEVADMNAGGRRLWVAQLRRLLTLTLRDRRDAIQNMGERDWLTEWNFCWKSMKSRRDEDFNGRRRRLKRLYTIWLQFQLFVEVVAEIQMSTVQSRDLNRAPSTGDESREKRASNASDSRSHSSSTSGAESVYSTTTGGSAALSQSTNASDDVDAFQLKTLRLEYGSKTWRGEKRLMKEVSDISRFRHTLEELVSLRGMQDALNSFPVFPLMAAFSIRGVQVVATALPLSSEMEVVHVDKRDLSELSGGLRVNGGLSQFAFGEFPEIWIRRVRGAKEGELVRVSFKYDDVFRYSLRSPMVHGVLLRAGGGSFEVLSAHDVAELTQGKTSRWTPYLDLHYYQLDSGAGAVSNHSAKQFLLKRPKSDSCMGDVVIAVNAEQCRISLNLKEAFVQKYQIELLPVLRRLQEMKQMRQGMQLSSSENAVSDPTATITTDLEYSIKRLLRRHVQDVAVKLITLGDDVTPVPTNTPTRMSRAASSLLFAQKARPAPARTGSVANPALAGFRRRQSSVDSMNGNAYGTGAGGSIYVIDAMHLRRVFKRHGVNMRLLPLAFAYLDPMRQPGILTLLASEIVARIAKFLFQFRLSHDQNAEKSRWRSRKSRLIEFLGQIMRGLFEEDGASQFWDVDAPIWFMLGPFASSIALADYTMIKPDAAMQSFRHYIRNNPSTLFNCLLQAFGAHLTDAYLPSLHEARWKSLHFLRREGQLRFLDEAIDPKLALTYHPGWLSAANQSFHVQFEGLQRLFVNGGGSITEKSEIQNAKVFFDTLTSQFRLSIACASETRVENAILAVETQQTACQLVAQAHQALLEYRLLSARDLAQQACDALSTFGAHSSFPLELKVCLVIISALCDRDSLLSPTRKGANTSTPKWSVVFTWLQHFYRASNNSHVLSTLCPHPLSEAIRLLTRGQGLASFATGTISSPGSSLLRVRVEKGAELDLWEELAPIVERQLRAPGNPTSSSGVNLDRTKSMTAQKRVTLSSHGEDAVRKSSPNPASLFVKTGEGDRQALELAGPLTASAWDRVLRTLELHLLPVIRDTKGCWQISGYLFDSAQAQQTRFPPAALVEESMLSPGMAFLWGRSMGLSLDEEAKLSTVRIDGLTSRPHNINDISVLEVPLPIRRVLQVSCGYRHTAFVTSGDYGLYTFGYGECGRLGHGDEQSVDLPKRVEFFSSLARNLGGPLHAGVRQVACGREHTMVVLNNGELYGFGWAEAGRLGTGESGSVSHPSKVATLADVHSVACGREHTLVIAGPSNVYAFGAGFGGRLGNDAENDEELPVFIAGLEGECVVSVDAGECHSCALTKDGDVFTWGFGSSGALGHGARDNSLVPTKVNGPWIEDRVGDRVAGVACGSYHTLAYTAHGRLYGWGDSAAGQLGEQLVDAPEMVVLTPEQIKLPRSPTFQGEPNSVQRIHSLACGTFTSAVSTTDGKLFMWGSPAAGYGAALDRDEAKIKQVNLVSEFAVGQVSCGAYHSVALTQTPVYN